jgi:hypothetical protein
VLVPPLHDKVAGHDIKHNFHLALQAWTKQVNWQGLTKLSVGALQASTKGQLLQNPAK